MHIYTALNANVRISMLRPKDQPPYDELYTKGDLIGISTTLNFSSVPPIQHALPYMGST